MTTATLPSSRSQRRRGVHRRPRLTTAPPAAAPGTVVPLATEARADDPIVPVNPQHHGGTVVFEVPLTSAMGGSDLELLRRQLAITTHVDHKLPVDPNSPGHAQLDQDSSLLLERGVGSDRWVLQARTWGRPSPRTVHDWQVRVAQVARRLDPQVSVPGRMPPAPPATPLRPVGRAANARFAAARRRLTGLPSLTGPPSA